MIRQFFSKPDSDPDDTGRITGAKMVKCSYCDLYIPEDAAITVADRPYCSEEHSKLAKLPEQE